MEFMFDNGDRKRILSQKTIKKWLDTDISYTQVLLREYFFDRNVEHNALLNQLHVQVKNELIPLSQKEIMLMDVLFNKNDELKETAICYLQFQSDKIKHNIQMTVNEAILIEQYNDFLQLQNSDWKKKLSLLTYEQLLNLIHVLNRENNKKALMELIDGHQLYGKLDMLIYYLDWIDTFSHQSIAENQLENIHDQCFIYHVLCDLNEFIHSDVFCFDDFKHYYLSLIKKYPNVAKLMEEHNYIMARYFKDGDLSLLQIDFAELIKQYKRTLLIQLEEIKIDDHIQDFFLRLNDNVDFKAKIAWLNSEWVALMHIAKPYIMQHVNIVLSSARYYRKLLDNRHLNHEEKQLLSQLPNDVIQQMKQYYPLFLLNEKEKKFVVCVKKITALLKSINITGLKEVKVVKKQDEQRVSLILYYQDQIIDTLYFDNKEAYNMRCIHLLPLIWDYWRDDNDNMIDVFNLSIKLDMVLQENDQIIMVMHPYNPFQVIKKFKYKGEAILQHAIAEKKLFDQIYQESSMKTPTTLYQENEDIYLILPKVTGKKLMQLSEIDLDMIYKTHQCYLQSFQKKHKNTTEYINLSSKKEILYLAFCNMYYELLSKPHIGCIHLDNMYFNVMDNYIESIDYYDETQKNRIMSEDYVILSFFMAIAVLYDLYQKRDLQSFSEHTLTECTLIQ